MSDPFMMSEGFPIDDAGNIIGTTYVDLRPSANRSPISILVKACAKRHALEAGSKLRLSKPELFREYGENLIRDVAEGNPSQTTHFAERVDDPEDLAKARLRNAEHNRASELVGSGFTVNTTTVKSSRKSSRWLTFGQNWWIFCTSIEPTNTSTDRGSSLAPSARWLQNNWAPRVKRRK